MAATPSRRYRSATRRRKGLVAADSAEPLDSRPGRPKENRRIGVAAIRPRRRVRGGAAESADRLGVRRSLHFHFAGACFKQVND